MNRKETTEFLSNLLVQRKLAGKYYASEVTLNFVLAHFMKMMMR